MTISARLLMRVIAWKRPGARFSLQGARLDPHDVVRPDGSLEHATGLTWDGPDLSKPTQAEVDQWVAEYEAQGIAASEAADRDIEMKALKSVIVWVAKRLNIPLATARAEIRAIYLSFQ